MRSAELLDCKSLGGNTIRVSGHPRFCPTPVFAQLEGSVTSEGTIESGVIELGTRLVFLFEDHIPVTTSKVVHVQWDHTN
jgi:hypothetical protein